MLKQVKLSTTSGQPPQRLNTSLTFPSLLRFLRGLPQTQVLWPLSCHPPRLTLFLSFCLPVMKPLRPHLVIFNILYHFYQTILLNKQLKEFLVSFLSPGYCCWIVMISSLLSSGWPSVETWLFSVWWPLLQPDLKTWILLPFMFCYLSLQPHMFVPMPFVFLNHTF